MWLHLCWAVQQVESYLASLFVCKTLLLFFKVSGTRFRDFSQAHRQKSVKHRLDNVTYVYAKVFLE